MCPRDVACSTRDGQDAADQAQVDFMEMLRVRDERRRKRQEEVLRQQRLQEAGQDEVTRASWQETRVGGEMPERGRSQETALADISANSTVTNQVSDTHVVSVKGALMFNLHYWKGEFYWLVCRHCSCPIGQ